MRRTYEVEREYSKMNKYVFKSYNPIFAKLFQKEQTRLRKVLGKSTLIEHVGSTAIPGLGGKGIIDILIAAPKNEIQDTSEKLQKAGYEFRPQASTETRLFFRQDLPDSIESVRRYHIHLTLAGSTDWTEILAFRDFLLTHPKELEKYQEIKIKAADEAKGEGQKYKGLKEPFIQEIIKRSLKLKKL